MNNETQEERGIRRDTSDRKVGAFVTNKWLVGMLVTLVMLMGGYIFKGYDKSTDAQASQIQALDHRMNALEIDNAAVKATIALQNAEVIRRLDRIENAIYGAGAAFRRSGQFTPVPRVNTAP